MEKNKNELYRGPAIVMGISVEGAEDWPEKERNKLSEADRLNAFKIVYDVAEGDANGARHDVKVEVSHSELTGKMLEYCKREDGCAPTQIDAAICSLVWQGILPRGAKEADLASALDNALVGREVTVRVCEDQKDDGEWWPARATFCSKYKRLVGEDMAARVAAFLSGKPAAKPIAVRSASASSVVPSAPDDNSDMPF